VNNQSQNKEKMENVSQVVASQQKRKRGPAKKTVSVAIKEQMDDGANQSLETQQPPTKRTRQTTKWKSPLLKIYNENVVAIDVIKDLGSISSMPMSENTTKRRLTITFKHKKHEPIIICVEEDDIKSVTKRVKDYARKYGTTATDDMELESEEDEELKQAKSKQVEQVELELEMQAYENGDFEQEVTVTSPTVEINEQDKTRLMVPTIVYPMPEKKKETGSKTDDKVTKKAGKPVGNIQKQKIQKAVEKIEQIEKNDKRDKIEKAPKNAEKILEKNLLNDEDEDDIFNESDQETSASSRDSVPIHSPEA
jgi:hypothetical protein